jgi:hypothetical protein
MTPKSQTTIKLEDFVQVTINGVPYAGIVIQIDETNGNFKVAVQELPLPIWITPKPEQSK